MKVLAIATLALATSVLAQAPPTPPPPPNAPAANRPPAPAAAQPTPLEPKKSEATAELELAETKKQNLEMQKNFMIQQANSQIQRILSQEQDLDKSAAEQQETVRKENSWGPEAQYVPPQTLQDGSTQPGHWQKAPEGNKK